MLEKRIRTVLKLLKEARETIDEPRVADEAERLTILRVLLAQAELMLLRRDAPFHDLSDT